MYICIYVYMYICIFYYLVFEAPTEKRKENGMTLDLALPLKMLEIGSEGLDCTKSIFFLSFTSFFL